MAESSWYDFLIPSEETQEAIKTGISRARRDVRILKSEGPEALEKRYKEEKFLDQGFSDEEAKKLAQDEIDNDTRFALIPKDFALTDN